MQKELTDLKALEKENLELQEWKRMLVLILQYASEITSMTQVKDILNSLADISEKILNADRCTVFLLDKNRNELSSWLAHGLERQEIKFSATKGIAGSVATSGQALIINDAYSDRRFNPEVDKLTGYKTKTILCVPMRNLKGEVIGVFQVLNKLDGKLFTERDREVITLFAQQAASAIESTKLYEQEKKTFESFINTLAETIDARDPMTAGHSRRVCGYSVLIAENLDYTEEEQEILKYASLLHDLGKIGVKEAILTKPDSLTQEEFIHIQKHTAITKRILEQTNLTPKFKDIPVIASSHHENMDGSGYPAGMSGQDIPEGSRIMAVADVFDALTYRRHYRNPMTMDKVIEELLEESAKKFDPRCIFALLEVSIYDILAVMFEGLGKNISAGTRYKFSNICLRELYESYQEDTNRKLIKEFESYYPVGIFEE